MNDIAVKNDNLREIDAKVVLDELNKIGSPVLGEYVFCMECGTKIKKSDKFCINCGAENVYSK